MSKDDVMDLLNRIRLAYPMFWEGRSDKALIQLWLDCLREEEADQVNQAFIQYYRDDVRNLPPTPGNLLEYIPEEPALPFLGWGDDA